MWMKLRIYIIVRVLAKPQTISRKLNNNYNYLMSPTDQIQVVSVEEFADDVRAEGE